MNETHRLAIFGASGHGKVVADIALQTGWEAVVFYDDAWRRKPVLEHWQVHGGMLLLLQELPGLDGIVVAVGNNHARETIGEKLLSVGAQLVTLVHPKAAVSPFALLGQGSVIMPGAVVNAFAKLGDGALVNSGATVDHDCLLDDYVHVAPGAHLSGNVRVGRGSWIGIGSSVRQGVSLGERVMVGAGAVVVADVPDGLTVAGIPARPLGESEKMPGVTTERLG